MQFDSAWGGPKRAVTFASLQDWTQQANPGIKYFSGTAVYTKTFDVPASQLTQPTTKFIDLGIVNHIARVQLNGKDLGVVWTAPWRIKIQAGPFKKRG